MLAHAFRTLVLAQDVHAHAHNMYLVLYISQLSNQIAEHVDNIFRIIHVFVDNIVSIVMRLCFCLKSYVAVERNKLAIERRPKAHGRHGKLE